jgi:tryptophanyl-tRNA synthetase
MDLQNPTSKMSKTGDTEAGCIMMMDEPSEIARKFKRAVTDSDNEVRFDRGAKPGVSNLLEILAVCTGSTPQELVSKYTQYGPLKTDAGDAVIELLRPIQSRYTELMTDRGELARLLRKGSDKAGEVAAATLERAYAAIGFLPR